MAVQQIKFTKAALAGLEPDPSRRIYVRDTVEPSLYLSVTPKGIKSFLVYRWGDGKPQRVTLGRFDPERRDAMTVAAARRKVTKTVDKIRSGDVNRAKRLERHAPTVADLADEYLERHAKVKKKSAAEDERILNTYVLPKWKTKKAQDIGRHDVVTLLDGIADRAPVMANRVLACTRKMFNVGVQRGILNASPCVQIPAPGKESRRDRVLSQSEIKTFWSRLDEAAVDERTRLILRFQLATAQRVGEVVSMQWNELDNGTWTIPAEKAKNGLPHRVPLNAVARDILKRAKKLSDGKRYVFESVHEGHIRPDALPKALARNREVLGVGHIVPHDLRRTAASMMTGMGIPRLVVGRVLNHAEPGVTAIYDRHAYDAEKRQALEKWGRKLDRIIRGKSGQKVVSLR